MKVFLAFSRARCLDQFGLSACFDYANLGQGDTIVFDPSILGDNQTIVLTGRNLEITDDVTITGPGKGLGDPEFYDLTNSGNNSSRIFAVVGSSLGDSGIKLTGGNSDQWCSDSLLQILFDYR